MANLTLYDYYTTGGISNGLSVDQPYFTLNNKNFSIYSGSMHYFRVPNEYWRDRLKKMKAAGLNTVQTYVPWNLHEPEPGTYDFGNGGTDFQDFLDIEKFLKTVQEEDMFAIVRPGPFICAEYEFGGMPSWLLREEDIKVRTSDEKFMKHVTRYFNVLLQILATLQFTKGGPIIALQVENEYGSTSNPNGNPPFMPDKVYLEQLRQLMLNNNITELLFTSDSPYSYGDSGSLSTLFQTANFNSGPEDQFQALQKLQGDKPYMATEYWSGWFNHWSESHYQGNILDFTDVYTRILKYPASVNLYMFHGGTTWGFLNGANKDNLLQSSLAPDITSYDYDAPLTEYGTYNLKYDIVRNLLKIYNKVPTYLPDKPVLADRKAYPKVAIQKYLSYADIVDQLPYNIKSNNLQSMEMLPINNNSGQSFGYILYRKSGIDIDAGSVLKIVGYVYDHVNVYINNKRITNNVVKLEEFGYWKLENGTLTVNEEYKNATLDLVVENIGRCNFGQLEQFRQFKGLWEGVLLDDQEILDWEILPIEFKKSWTSSLTNWKDFNASTVDSYETGFYKIELNLEEDPLDTFIDMSDWKKGMVVVNNFVLGRHWQIGPQQSLYLPAPFLKNGTNEIIVFEEFSPNTEMKFIEDPIFFNNLKQ